MHLRMLAFIGLAGLLIASPAAVAAEAGCCGEKAACCEKASQPEVKTHDHGAAMACCKDLGDGQGISFRDLFGFEALAAETTTPARQATFVWFQRPVRVGNHILQGRYVIEHDNDRMARGEPCTHIYAFDDQRMPVVAFHCTHLERGVAKEHKAVLVTLDGSMQRLVEFQFAGESTAHGVPTER